MGRIPTTIFPRPENPPGHAQAVNQQEKDVRQWLWEGLTQHNVRKNLKNIKQAAGNSDKEA